MFTGIIEATGRITSIQDHQSNRIFIISSPIASSLKIGESVSHSGVCLTVESIFNEKNSYQVTAVAVTLEKTAMQALRVDGLVNLERALKADGRLDGHFVQGHVDSVATITSIEERDGSSEYWFEFLPEFQNLLVAQGSICVNGISLTVSNLKDNQFSVNIIPHTKNVTDISTWKIGITVNLEFDILGKYILRFLEQRQITK
ncbi:MAG: riboflavin synthase [Leptonema sp. (in: Bacteria)]|nr:riboflavin synthase [Leptonema sp. (in: bacteria)]